VGFKQQIDERNGKTDRKEKTILFFTRQSLPKILFSFIEKKTEDSWKYRL